MPNPTVWDHDLWADIYAIKDAESRKVIIRLYRLILEMHNKDVLSEQIASALRGERRLYLSMGQKIGAFALGIATIADFVIHLIQ